MKATAINLQKTKEDLTKSKILNVNENQDTQYAIPLWLRDEQIRSNVKKCKGRLQASTEVRTEPIAIVGFGPSLKDSWGAIAQFKWIIACSGATQFLLERGITPNWHAAVDPLPELTKILIGQPHKDIEYLIASTCHPDVIEHLKDYNLKLWHVFAQDNESEQVLPKGEWLIMGGSDIGMRCMSLARFLGFKDFHIFGLDGSSPTNTARHAGEHPNKKTQSECTTICNGREFKTTPAMLQCAKQVFHELDQLSDVTFKFYGDGLIQEMGKNYTRKSTGPGAPIAAVKPELISEEMRLLNQQLHEDNPYYGVGGGKYAETVLAMKTDTIHSILDYGAGKGYLAKALPFPIWQYDPCVPEIAEAPRPADLVVCSDMLEHVEIDKLQYVLADLKRVVLQIGYFVIHMGAAQKTYADNRNTHLIQESAEWWVEKLKKYFDVATAQVKGKELHVVVGLKTVQDDPNAIIGVRGKDGVKSRFHIPNQTTKWRAETLASKEPVTIDWVEKIPKDAVLYDIGANVGGYTVWAAKRGVKVLAFEPEAENYALLNKNIALNEIDSKAYCLAVTDKQKLDVLHLSNRGVGGSCHSFGNAVDAFGAVRNGNHPEQACIGISVDELVKQGLPKPDYMKIDVDGFEPLVIKGAADTLKDIKSLIIEVNPALPEHLEMVDILTNIYGFSFNERQVREATRNSGTFKGVAEYVFFRQTKAEKHILKAIESAELVLEPYPYFIVKNALPEEDYAALQLATKGDYVPIEEVRGLKGYPQRLVNIDFARPEWMDAVKLPLLNKFGRTDDHYTDEHLLIHDKVGYKIGPHTDVPARVLSAILYLAKDDRHPELGTDIYVPKDRKLKSIDGKHFRDSSKFRKHLTVPYEPNTMFVFLRTDNSFHGVTQTKLERDVLLYDIRRQARAVMSAQT